MVLAAYGLVVALSNIVFMSEVANAWQVHPKADVDCGSLTAIALPRFGIRVSGFVRATPAEDLNLENCGKECRRA